MLLDKEDHHQLFFNQLFFVEEDLGMPITWFSDADDSMAIIAGALKGKKVIGVDKDMPARWLLPLMDMVNAKFVIASDCIDLVRGVKDEHEIALMIKASQINDEAMGYMQKTLAEGTHSEKEMDPLLLGEYKRLGATAHSFEPIVGYGKNGADPHHENDDTKLVPGDSIIVDMGCVYEGYCSDMTRTFFYKEATDKQRYVYNLVLKAQEAAEAAIKPGVALSEIDKIARDIITEGGYGKEFNHRLGHFIGRLCHEAGEVNATSEIIAEEGMIFSIEPGVYIPGEFGVRIEDLVLVIADGVKILNHYPKDLTII
jgi:Xaa-Pro dipeptidase